MPAGYSGTSLPRKLAIKAGAKVRTFGAPEYFEQIVSPLPEGARFVRSGEADLIVVFATSAADMELRFAKALACAATGARIWIAWPKKSSKVPTDLGETKVREHGLSMGWVDFKVCAIDATWSGHLFAQKNKPER
jgi:hypothetical protein